jgi:hypothetical protein
MAFRLKRRDVLSEVGESTSNIKKLKRTDPSLSRRQEPGATANNTYSTGSYKGESAVSGTVRVQEMRQAAYLQPTQEIES